MRQSLGLAVNYVYRLAHVERNHESYAKTGKIAAAYELEALARRVSRTRTAITNDIKERNENKALESDAAL